VASTFRFTGAVRALVCAGLAVAIPWPALAQTPPAPAASQPATAATAPTAQDVRDELDKLRKEFEAVRDSYGARLSALEEKLATMGAPATPVPAEQPQAAAQPAPGVPATTPAPTAATEVQAPAGAAGAGGPQGTLPVYGNASAMSKIFNPDIAVIGNFIGAAGRNTIAPRPALGLDEAEATYQAVVDPYARADFFLSFSPEGVEIEEGFLTLTSLPGGLLAKVGKFKEQVGKVNTLHAHTLPWVDTPLMMTNLFGSEEGLSDSGVSVSKLITNPWLFLEATGEVYAGNSGGTFTSHQRGNLSYVGRLRGYRDVTESTNIDVGGSFAYGTNDVGPDNKTRLIGFDATVRYRPLRRAIYKRFQGRTEMFWSRRAEQAFDVNAFGMYASGEYQFARRWFAGARYDWSERAYDSSLVDKGPSLVLTYWPSEFSQIRGQYRHTRYAENVNADEVLFQFLFSIGAHGAHVF
jgi:hypothetical protein